jgi:hypothetical protein
MTPSTPLTSQDLWLSGLQGRVLDGEYGESADYREGRLVRQLFTERAQSRQGGERTRSPLSPQKESVHWQSILEKARRDGLFASNPKPAQSGWWQRLGGHGTGDGQAQESARSTRIAANQRFYALAAGFAVVAVGLTLVMETMKTAPEDSGEVVFRGDEVAQRIVLPEAQVAELADRIEAVLKQHQLAYRRTAIGPTTIQIQAKVPMGVTARPELEKLGVVVPEHGRMNALVTSN